MAGTRREQGAQGRREGTSPCLECPSPPADQGLLDSACFRTTWLPTGQHSERNGLFTRTLLQHLPVEMSPFIHSAPFFFFSFTKHFLWIKLWSRRWRYSTDKALASWSGCSRRVDRRPAPTEIKYPVCREVMGAVETREGQRVTAFLDQWSGGLLKKVLSERRPKGAVARQILEQKAFQAESIMCKGPEVRIAWHV